MNAIAAYLNLRFALRASRSGRKLSANTLPNKCAGTRVIILLFAQL